MNTNKYKYTDFNGVSHQDLLHNGVQYMLTIDNVWLSRTG